jgi:hypothetical protein
MTGRAANGRLAGPVRGPDEMGMSITYYTGRLLDALAAHPGASGRQLALAAGAPYAYEEQVAPLLASLERLGFARRDRAGADDESDAWQLTADGSMLQRAVWDGSVEASGNSSEVNERRGRAQRRVADRTPSLREVQPAGVKRGRGAGGG